MTVFLAPTLVLVHLILFATIRVQYAFVEQSAFKAMSLYRKGVGEQLVNVHFPTDIDLSSAISSAWNVQHEKCWSGGIAMKCLKTAGEESAGAAAPYLACSTNEAIRATAAFFQSEKISYHVSYSSASDDSICYVLQARITQVERIFSSPTVTFQLLEPIPTLLKLDQSIQLSLFDPKGLSSTYDPRTRLAHPMIHSILNNRTVEIVVMLAQLHAGTSTSNSVEQLDPWWSSFAIGDKSQHSSVWQGVHWVHELQKGIVGEDFQFTPLKGSSGHTFTVASNKEKQEAFSRSLRTAVELQQRSGEYEMQGVEPTSGVRPLLSSSENRSPFPFLKRKLGSTANAAASVDPLVDKQHSATDRHRSFWTRSAAVVAGLFSTDSVKTQCALSDIQATWRGRSLHLTLPYNSLLSHLIDPLPVRNFSGKSSSLSASTFEVKSSCLAYIIAAIAAHPAVHKVTLSRPMRTQNDHSRQIIQSGTLDSSTASPAEVKEPLSAAGLDGSGTVIAISDTGIDEHHCFFRDDVNGLVPRSDDPLDPVVIPSHRKIIQYVNFSGSGGDYRDGHGSHVAGTLAGHCVSEGSAVQNDAKNVYEGMAHMAKLAFFDIGENDQQKDLIVPDDFGTYMFPSAQSAGAVVHSNSWGGGYLYDAFCVEVDKYLYKHPELAIFYAAGNDGGEGSQTTLSPGISKNAISVGATNSGRSNAQSIDEVVYFSATGPTFDGRIKPDIVAPGYSTTSTRANAEGTGDTNSCDMESKSGTSMATPSAAGNAALIVQYFQDAQFWASVCNTAYRYCTRGAFTPSGLLIKAMVLHSGKAMSIYRGAGSVGVVTLSGNPPDTYQGYGRMDLSSLLLLPQTADSHSSFQGKGAKGEGRLEERVEEEVGDGEDRYISRYRMHAAMDSVATAGAERQRALQQQQGVSQKTIYVDESDLAELTELVYAIEIADASSALRATLCWYDPPNEVFAAKVLQHDLDLVVTDPDGKTFFGNTENANGQPAMGSHRDELNTNEQVTVQAPIPGRWEVRVQAKMLTQAPTQRFALVISGSGVVSEDGAVLNSISPALLDKCHMGTGTPSTGGLKLEVDFALWARVEENGWLQSDSYTVRTSPNTYPGSDDGPTASPSTVYQGDFQDSFSLSTVQSVCLSSAACYSVELDLRANSRRGSQLSVPQCNNIFLSPLSPQRAFCVDAPVQTKVATYSDQEGGSSSSTTTVLSFAEDACTSLCGRGSHVSLPFIAAEFQGAGWTGTYYTFSETGASSASSESSTYFSATGPSGTLEWGFLEAKSECLPYKSSTYDLLLSFPDLAEDSMEYPELFFNGSFQLREDLTTNSASEQAVTLAVTNAPCDLELNTSIPFARIHIAAAPSTSSDFSSLTSSVSSVGEVEEGGERFDGASSVSVSAAGLSTITFYSFAQHRHDFGQTPLTQAEYNDMVRDDNLVKVGSCTVNPSYHSMDSGTSSTPAEGGSAPPTLAPVPNAPYSLGPTVFPTTDKPSATPSFYPLAAPSPAPLGPVTLAPSNVNDPSAELYGHSFSCLIDCPGYSGTVDFKSPGTQAACEFLLSVYHSCDSFAVGAGYCVAPACAADCAADDWCYFGAGSSTTCPNGLWSENDPAVAEVSAQCTASMAQQGGTSSGGGSDGDAPSAVTSPAPTTQSSSSAASLPPTDSPTSVPHDDSTEQTHLFGYNFTCLSDCPSFPGASVFVNASLSQMTCAFLLEIYHLCDSFALSSGYCSAPDCASDCAVVDWCYFGAATAVVCPFGEWKQNDTAITEIQSQCMVNTVAVSGGGAGPGTADAGADAAGALVLMSVVIAMIVVCGVLALLSAKPQRLEDCCQALSVWLSAQRSYAGSGGGRSASGGIGLGGVSSATHNPLQMSGDSAHGMMAGSRSRGSSSGNGDRSDGYDDDLEEVVFDQELQRNTSANTVSSLYATAQQQQGGGGSGGYSGGSGDSKGAARGTGSSSGGFRDAARNLQAKLYARVKGDGSHHLGGSGSRSSNRGNSSGGSGMGDGSGRAGGRGGGIGGGRGKRNGGAAYEMIPTGSSHASAASFTIEYDDDDDDNNNNVEAGGADEQAGGRGGVGKEEGEDDRYAISALEEDEYELGANRDQGPARIRSDERDTAGGASAATRDWKRDALEDIFDDVGPDLDEKQEVTVLARGTGSGDRVGGVVSNPMLAAVQPPRALLPPPPPRPRSSSAENVEEAEDHRSPETADSLRV